MDKIVTNFQLTIEAPLLSQASLVTQPIRQSLHIRCDHFFWFKSLAWQFERNAMSSWEDLCKYDIIPLADSFTGLIKL